MNSLLLNRLVFHRFVPTATDLDLAHLAAFGMMAIFVSMLVGLTFIDLRHYIIPDEFSSYAVPVGIACASGLGSLGGAHPAIASGWRDAVLGAFWRAGVGARGRRGTLQK